MFATATNEKSSTGNEPASRRVEASRKTTEPNSNLTWQALAFNSLPIQPRRTQASEAGAPESPPIVRDVLNSAGESLDPTTRSLMERRFNHDFHHVRVYTNSRAAESARALDANAYTVGRNIVFDTNRYQNRTVEGQRLLAHELAHVVQVDTGARQRAYRNGGRDSRRIQRALRHATTTLAGSVRYLPSPQLAELVNAMVAIIGGFFPTGHGQIDEHGRIARESPLVRLEQPFRHGGLTDTYTHLLRVFLSEERPTEQARYQPTPIGRDISVGGGEIRIFVHNVVSLTEPELIAALAHELVHLFTDVFFRTQFFGNRLRTQQAPSSRTGTTTRSRPISITIGRADVTLGGSREFERLTLALHRTYIPVIEFLNQQRIARGAQVLDPVALSAQWAGRTADELLAFVVDQQVDVAVQLASGRGPGRVALIPTLEPLAFFRTYAGRHWLDDERDRQALQQPAADPILRRAGSSGELRAVYQALQQWVMPPAPAPTRPRP